jgi:hypothetical protein
VAEHRPQQSGRPGSETLRHPRLSAARAVQLLVASWLLLSPWVLPGARDLVMVKGVAVGAVLLTVTAATTVQDRVRRIEAPVCLVLGVVLIAASVLLEFGSGDLAAARKWNQVAVGVMLVYLAAARVR